ncbi:hypothetical protein B0T10DRAFT_487088 [Thelonectria olida]|uniref:Uncharacterized protein n=1 Tax=Thelonectria olida TaxID=1576542 RepID=A0A9P8W886_9HYPO|nr:hypothetical protein B0T10DRAFT_487088 [Thelonectria olida]
MGQNTTNKTIHTSLYKEADRGAKTQTRDLDIGSPSVFEYNITSARQLDRQTPLRLSHSTNLSITPPPSLLKMKLGATFVSLVASQAVCILAAPSAEAPAADTTSLEAECGALGVMNWDLDSLPDNVDRSQLRKCKEHPEDHTSPYVKRDLFKRKKGSCVHETDHGCGNGGYCWRSCKATHNFSQRFHWCWQAWNKGYGDWVKCKSADDCNAAFFKGGTCSHKGDCDACGCGHCCPKDSCRVSDP